MTCQFLNWIFSSQDWRLEKLTHRLYQDVKEREDAQ
jgi:hypothetical protein